MPEHPYTRLQEGQYESSVPNTGDRVAQTAAAMLLEQKLEPVFHRDSYGYRPGRSAHDALAVCRRRCWAQDWVLDLDVRAFFDSVPHSLLLKAVAHHTSERWVLLYISRWLKAPMQMPDGTIVPREKGTPQGSPITPPTQQRTFAHVTLRVGFVVVAAAAGWFPDGDAVADGDLLGSDEDVLHDGAQDALACLRRWRWRNRPGGCARKPSRSPAS